MTAPLVPSHIGDRAATAAQQEFLGCLTDKVERNYDSKLPFYDIVERVSGQRTTARLTSKQASRVIELVKEELTD